MCLRFPRHARFRGASFIFKSILWPTVQPLQTSLEKQHSLEPFVICTPTIDGKHRQTIEQCISNHNNDVNNISFEVKVRS